MLFWKLPNEKQMAFIPRTGSTAWAQTIIDKLYPELKHVQDNTHMPKGTKAKPLPQFILPSERRPHYRNAGQLVAVTRDPIERFRSAFSRLKCETVDEAIAKIKAAKNVKQVNIHVRSVTENFREASRMIKWYAYEQDLGTLAVDIGLGQIPAKINVSTEEKPSLSRNQLLALREIYAADIKLHQDTLRGKIL